MLRRSGSRLCRRPQHKTEIVQRLDARLAQAQRTGDLGFLNREYKRRGEHAQALSRKEAIVATAGNPAPIMTRVFEGSRQIGWRKRPVALLEKNKF